MLKGLNPLLRGAHLAVLRELGHGDRVCIADCNFPASELARTSGIPMLAMDCDAIEAGRAILSVFPLDSFVEAALFRMEIDGAPEERNEAHRDFEAMLEEEAGPGWPIESIERFTFYSEAAGCAAIIATLERRGFANFILKKGVIGPDGEVVMAPRRNGSLS